MTKIVHCKKAKYDFYCGRPTIYGNIYIIGKDGDRAEVIEKYRTYFNNRIATDIGFKEAVLKLKNKTIACWCNFPEEDCHLRIIKEFVDNYE